MFVSGTSEGTAAEPFFAAGFLGLSASGGAAAAAMDDGDKKEKESDYGEVLESCFYLVPSSAKRAIKWWAFVTS